MQHFRNTGIYISNCPLSGNNNEQMKNASCLIPLCILFGLIVTELHAQDLNDEMKKRLRQSLITPEKQSGQQQYQHSPQILPEQDREILKVSPTTRLPTRGDKIQLLNPPEKYKTLVWADEFDGDALDENKWEIQLGTGGSVGLFLWGNNEQQFYRRENISVENGLLRIRAQRENFGNMEYTSGRIRSLNLGDFKYGRMEARIRMDNTPGLWHAFWMLPSNPPVGWPMSGEIDVMEYVGNMPNVILHYIHLDRILLH